jgi:hypothetical protein
MEDLQRHVSVVLEVLGQVDRGHATGTELALDAVAVSQGRGQALQGLSQVPSGMTWIRSI